MPGGARRDPKRFVPRGIHEQISTAKNQLVDPAEYRNRVESFYDQTVADAYELYQRRLFAANAVDFDDLLMLTVQVLERFPEAKERWQKAFRYVLVDEYQDTNHAQYRLLQLLAEKHRNVCVVGDPDQSIYAFRGADIRNILEFERDFGETRVVPLEQNYRSTNTILRAANHVISHNTERKPKNLWSDLGDGEPVRVLEVEDEHAEARWVASEIAGLVDEGVNGDEIAVFYRTNAQSRVLEDVLVRSEIPYQVIGGPRFYERAEVKDAIAYLQVIDNPYDAVSMQRIANRPRRGIGDASLARLQTYADGHGFSLWEALEFPEEAGLGPAQVRAVTALRNLLLSLQAGALELPVDELVERTLERSGYMESLEAERTIEAQGRMENLHELIGVAQEYQASAESPSLSTFLQEISLFSDQDSLREQQSLVTLMTLHNAKGLEFKAVFMIGMEEGIFPHSRSLEENSLEEERRLAYVGMTRARAPDADARGRPVALRVAQLQPSVPLPRRAAAGGDPPRAAAAVVLVRLRRAGGADPAARRQPGPLDGRRRPSRDARRGHRHRRGAGRRRQRPLRRGHGPAARARLRAAGANRLSIEIRPARPEEFPEVVRPIMHYFGRLEPDNEFTARFGPIIPADRIHAAFEDGEVVGSGGVFPFETGIPGGLIRAAGITLVGVLPTHRRRGSCGGSCGRRSTTSTSAASPWPICGPPRTRSTGASATASRRSAGMWRSRATARRSTTTSSCPAGSASSRRTRPSSPSPRSSGRRPSAIRGCSCARRTGGGIGDWPTRSGAARAAARWCGRCWSSTAGRRRMRSTGSTSRRCAGPDRLHQRDRGDRRLAGGHREIWRYLLDIDWMARVRAQLLPLDHELFLLLREPRRLSFEYRDGLWVRLVDVEAALNARSYKPGEPVVIELVDEFCPWNAGRWRVGPDGAERTDAEAELAMPVESLGSAYLGGFSFGELARAGRVEELAKARSTGRTGSSAPTATRGAPRSSELI